MGSSVALVVLDSLRADSFQQSFDWLNGKRFSHAYSNSHWTIPSHVSLFTGKYASEVGVHGKSPMLDCPEATIAEHLCQAGYSTSFYSANPMITYWNGWERGFDEVVEPARLDPRDENLIDWSQFAWEHPNSGVSRAIRAVLHSFRSDCPTVPAIKQGIRYWGRSRADGGIKKIRRRVKGSDYRHKDKFLVINLMETHAPYHAPDDAGSVDVKIGEAFTNSISDPERIREGYAESVSYLSDEYQKLHAILVEDFDYVITVGDHGEMLGEHKMWNHGYGLYPELVHVPFVISGGGVENEVCEDIVSLLDIHKTISEMAGVDINSRGQNLLKVPNERPLMTEFHGFLPWHREQFERNGVAEGVYDEHNTPLRGIVLPEGYAYETHSEGFCTDDDLDMERAKTELETIRSSVTERKANPFSPELDHETKRRLRNLGYA